MTADRDQRSMWPIMSVKPQVLKPQDILLLLKVSVIPDGMWTTRLLASEIFMSSAEVSDGLNRAGSARLFDWRRRKLIKRALEEFLIHGVKYVYPPERGGLTRGLPTCYAAPPLRSMIVQPNELPPVWPDPLGSVQGYAFSPLYRSVPQAAAADANLYEMLALVDTIRDGPARETELAVRELRKRLEKAGDQKE